MQSYSAVISSPLGKLGISTQNEKLAGIDFLASSIAEQQASDLFCSEVIYQLQAYFNSAQHIFSLPLLEIGTNFQQRVWQTLRTIPPGQSLSYGQLAKQLQTSARAIGNACRCNPIPIVTPCHRIVGITNLGGYSGLTTGDIWSNKAWLLKHEQES